MATRSSSDALREKILLCGFSTSAVLGLLYRTLVTRGKKSALFLPMETFLEKAHVSVDLSDSGFSAAFTLPDGTIADSKNLLSLCMEHHFVFVQPGAEVSQKDLQYVRTEGWALLLAVSAGLADKVLVANPSPAVDVSQSRASSISFLQRHGIPASPFLVTSDPVRAAAFYHEMNGEVIFKHVKEPDQKFQKMGAEDLKRIERISNCPVHMERFAAGKSVRFVVVGDDLFSFEERHLPSGEFQLIPFETAASIREKCLRSARNLGLHFAEIRLLYAEEGGWQALGIHPFISHPSLIYQDGDGRAVVLDAAAESLEKGKSAA